VKAVPDSDRRAAEESRNLRRIVRALSSSRPDKAKSAVAELDLLDASVTKSLLAEAKRLRRRTVGAFHSLAAFTIATAHYLVLAPAKEAFFVPGLLLCGLYALFLYFSAIWYGNRLFLLLYSLAESNNLGVLGPLLQGRVRPARIPLWLGKADTVDRAIVRLLKRLTRAERYLLDGEELKFLCSLATSEERDLACSAVDAVARLGGPEEIALLERLIQKTSPERAAVTVYPGIRQRARRALEQIQERRAREAPGDLLLRPSEAAPEQTLLHVSTASAVDEAVLLRSAAASGE
jgi:hypothetical protein